MEGQMESRRTEHTERWPTLTLKVVALIDLIFGVSGAYFIVSQLAIFHSGAIPYDSHFPYKLQAYFVMTSVNALLVACYIPTAVYVGRLKPAGRWMTNVLLGAQLLWEYGWALAALGASMAGGTWALVGQSMAAVSGIGGMGTALGTIIAYPIWGIILTNLAYRKIHRSDAGRAGSAESRRPETLRH